MNYTEAQIITKAKQVMKDLDGKFYVKDCTDGTIFNEKEEVPEGRFKGKIIPCWTIFIKAPFDNSDHLFISDETGEPIYYHNFNMMLFDIEKDQDGNYFKTEI